MGAELETLFIDDLVKKTLNQEVIWHSLLDDRRADAPQNQSNALKDKIDGKDKFTDRIIVEPEASYWTIIKDAYFYIFHEAVGFGERYSLYIQKSKDDKLLIVNTVNHDDELYRLVIAITNRIDLYEYKETEQFMTDYLNNQ